TVNGDVVEDAETAGAVQTALRERILPEIETLYGVETAEGGLAKQEREFLSEAAIALWACLFGIYVTLAWVFASWLRPLAVMMAIPFALIGAIWGHWVHGLPMSIFSIVGLIGMAGIVINDSIVLITTIDERAKRQAMAEAVVDGVCDRFRAVLLTTLTTVGGLAPLLFEQSRQALFLKPTVVTLAYGLGFGLILVLLVTPALVMLQHDVGLRLKSFRRSLSLARRRRKGLGTAARAPQA
ncbi:MAG: efflux RND transporter permease subunit, partial [Pseudomonadota bacterium]